MVGPRLSPLRQFWSITSTRFMRDVAASLLATGLATAAVSFAMREPATQPSVHQGKFDERLAWQVENVPTRQTRVYDTLAMFALPQAEPRAWSVAAPASDKVAVLAPASPVRDRGQASVPSIVQAEAGPHRTATDAVLPPHRPIVLARAEPPTSIQQRPASPEEVRQPVRVLGWNVPGSDLLPSRHGALQKVAALGTRALSFGGDVADFGGSLIDGIGLR